MNEAELRVFNMAGKWIAGAVKHPGALSKSAKAAGMSTQAFAQAHKHDKGKTGQRARLAITFSHMNHKRKGNSILSG